MTTIEMLEKFPAIILDPFDGCPHFFTLEKCMREEKVKVFIGYVDECDNRLHDAMHPLLYDSVEEAVKAMWEVLKENGNIHEEPRC